MPECIAFSLWRNKKPLAPIFKLLRYAPFSGAAVLFKAF
jgi:hypothetical protein